MESKWISVEDRLPDAHGFYFIYGKVDSEPAFCISYYDPEEKEDSWNIYTFEKITHWMPLPEPPEGGE